MSKITKEGRVVSNKMEKTIVVEVLTVKEHPLYKKKFKSTKKYKVDDPNNEFQVGEFVEIEQTKPISKEKCWRVSKKIS